MMKVGTCCCADGSFDEDDGFAMTYDSQNPCQFSGVYTHSSNDDVLVNTFNIENIDIIIDELNVEHDRLSSEFSKAKNNIVEIASTKGINNAATYIFDGVAAIYKLINGETNPYSYHRNCDESGLKYLKHAIEELIDCRDKLANVFEEFSHYKTSLTIIANGIKNAVITLRALPINKTIKECAGISPTAKEFIVTLFSNATSSNKDISAIDCIKNIDTNINELIVERDRLSFEFSKAKGNSEEIISMDDINNATNHIFNCIKIIDIVIRENNGMTNSYSYHHNCYESGLKYLDCAIEELLDNRNKLFDALKHISRLSTLSIKYLDVIVDNIDEARIALRYRPKTMPVKECADISPTTSNNESLDKIFDQMILIPYIISLRLQTVFRI